MMRLMSMHRGFAVARRSTMKLAPSSIATRSIIRLPDLPDQEKVNWHRELPLLVIKLLGVAAVYEAFWKYVLDPMYEECRKKEEKKLEEFYRAKFAAEADKA